MLFIIKYLNEIIAIIVLLFILALGFYVKHVFNERDRLESELDDAKAEVVQLERQQTLNDQITKAIQNIKVQSVNYVSAVEASNPPVDSSSVVFIDAGVFNPESMRKTNTTDNTAPSVTKD